MKKKKLHQYEILKIETNRFVTKKGSKYIINPLCLSYREALEDGMVVQIQSNQLTNKLEDYYSSLGQPMPKMIEMIVNIVVPSDAKKSGEKEYAELAKKGFSLNGKHYVRLYSGSGQIRRNTITFIREDLYEPIFTSLLCGLTLKDFGNDFNAAKFNAYCGLNMSGCHLLPDELTPKVCIVDDFEQIRPHNTVNYVTEEKVRYITLPEDDYILKDDESEFIIDGDKAIRKTDGVEFTIHYGIAKHIQSVPYDEIEDSPALNSFDGQGLMSIEWAKNVGSYLGWDYIPSELIIRAPWVKGLLVTIDFKEWFKEHGITEITDSFGKKRLIAELDCIISKSQFKMHKIYKAKCSPMGINAWDYHTQSMVQNRLKWGVVKPNKPDDETKALNYQYLQALQLSNADIESLCKRTEEFLRKLNSGNIDEVYENLIVNAKGFDDEEDSDNCNYKAFFQKVIEKNPDFINDKHIRELIFKECSTKLQGAKIGKILIRGNFQFCVADPIAQLEWIAHNHAGKDIEIKGVVPAGCVYSNYWLNADDYTEKITLLRSPLIDRNEIAKRTLIDVPVHYFKHLHSGIIYSIHDLTSLQQGGCDFDGDIIFSTNDEIIAKGSLDFATAKPLYYQLQSTDLVGSITLANIIEADVRGLNSAVGSISNKGVSLYAMLDKYDVDSYEYDKIYKSIVALGQVVGMEIDRIKTAVAPTFPLEWQSIQAKRAQNRNFDEVTQISELEQNGIYRHNSIVPSTKPYFFRYCYKYIDDAIKALEKSTNKVSIRNFKKNLATLVEESINGEATDEMQTLYKQFVKSYPVINTDCIVNHICHHFEDFEATIHRQTYSEGVNLLEKYIKSTPDEDMIKLASTIIHDYIRFKRWMAKSNNSNRTTNDKEKIKKSNEAMKMMRNYYRDKVIEIADGDLQMAFDILMCVAKSNHNLVWEVMDDYLLEIIKRG